MASSSGLSLAWSGDFDSLKEFLCKVCDFVGIGLNLEEIKKCFLSTTAHRSPGEKARKY